MDITLLSVGICSLNAAIWVLALNNTVAPHTASLSPPTSSFYGLYNM